MMTSPEASTPDSTRSALVTGASTGIGRATVVALTQEGWNVIAVARRADRVEELAKETGCMPLAGDITDDQDVEEMTQAAIGAGVDTLINVAGGARGQDPVSETQLSQWEWMYDVNVLGTLKLTQSLLPHLRQVAGGSTILNLTSTAALAAYEGGSGYNAAKAAERALTQALRLEEAEHNVRVIEVLPGMVATEEFSLRRFNGDQEKADSVYQGVERPLTGEDVADVVRYAVCAPHHVNLDEIVMRPVAQAAQYKVVRGPLDNSQHKGQG